jgi:hypothetical protein
VNLYRDTGVVLRVQKLGEADRIITLLTRRHGRVRAVAKGVRRTSSRFGARLEPFGHIDVQFYQGHTLDIVTQVETVDGFGSRLVGDYGRYTTGCAVLETAERLAGAEGEPVLRLYLLVVGALRALADGQRQAPLVLDAFLLRAMAAAAYRDRTRRSASPREAWSVPGAAHPARPARRRRLWSCWRLSCAGTGRSLSAPRLRSPGRAAAWSPPTCNGTWNANSVPSRWSNVLPCRIQQAERGYQ